MNKPVLCVLLILLSLTGGRALAQDSDLSFSSPSLFENKLSSLLAPAEEAVRLLSEQEESPEIGTVLLKEDIHWVGEDGKITRVIHRVLYAGTEAGAEALSQLTFPFRKGEQRMYLVKARTIQPDGLVLNVKPDAAFTHTPQYYAGYSLYTDSANMVVIFPNVKARSLVEYIIVTEEDEFRIQGEFTGVLDFQAYWPIARIRKIVELPSALADRLKITALGTGLPELSKEYIGKERIRFSWSAKDLKPVAYEPDRAPSEQVGPVVWLSTLEDWTAFASWYRGLLKGRDELGPELQKAVDSWTSEVSDRLEIIRLLHEKAANDVRYVGLNFGLAGFQPHPAKEVWENRYGDCKDKANLLRAMLKYKGINSYFTLINTEHAGKVEKQSPDYRHFDHAILTVDLDGDYLFCDPTAQYLGAGKLAPDDTNRDALLINESGYEFVTTPAQNGGKVTLDFDLNLNSGGSIEGWMTLTANDYMGSSFEEYLADREPADFRDAVRGYIERFYEDADLIDFEYSPTKSDNFKLKAFFITKNGSTLGTKNLTFPDGGVLFPDLDQYESRESSYYQWVTETNLNIRYTLPEGWAPTNELPASFSMDNAAVSVEAKWLAEEGACSATINYKEKKSLLSPEEYKGLYRTFTSLSAWMQTLVAVGPSAPNQVQLSAPSLSLDEFPLMPTAEGQMSLLERKFPLEGNIETRRAALKRVLQWFPEEKQTVFEANVMLADLLGMEGKTKEAIEQLSSLLASYRLTIDVKYSAWAEYLLAIYLNEAGDANKAYDIFIKIAANEDLSPYRRGWAYYEAAKIAKETSPDKTVEILEDAIKIESPALPDQLFLLGSSLLSGPEENRFADAVEYVVETHSSSAATVLNRLIEDAEYYLDWNMPDKAKKLALLLRKTIENSEENSSLAAALSELDEKIDANAAYKTIANKLKAYLADSFPERLASVPLEQYETAQQLYEIVARLYENGDQKQFLRHSLELLTSFPPLSENFGRQLWRTTVVAEIAYPDSPFFNAMLEFLEQLPAGDDYFNEAKFVRARAMKRAGDEQGEFSIYKQMADDPEMSLGFKVAARAYIGLIQEARGQYDKALETYRLIEADRDANLKSYKSILRAVFINLNLGNEEEALRLIQLFASLDDQDLPQTKSHYQIKELSSLGKNPAIAKSYWACQKKWFDQWAKIEKSLDAPQSEGEIIVPMIPDLFALGQDMYQAKQVGDTSRYLDLLRTVIHAARWQPNLVAEASSLLSDAAKLLPEKTYKFRELTMIINEAAVFDDSDFKQKRNLNLAVNYASMDRFQDVLNIAKTHLSEFDEDNEIRRSIVRLWGLAAVNTGKGLAEAAEALEQQLEADSLGSTRIAALDILLQAYRALGRPKDEADRIALEINSPEIKSDAKYVEHLRRRLERLSREGLTVDEFSTAVKQWLEQNKPEWFDLAKPASIQEAVRNFDIEKALAGYEYGLSKPEIFKLGVLTALDQSQPKSLRIRAFNKAIEVGSDGLMGHDKARAFLDSVYKIDEFAIQIRTYAIWQSAIHAAKMRDLDGLKHYMNNRLFNSIEPRLIERIESFKAFAEIDASSPSELKSFSKKLLTSPLDITKMALIYKSLNLLMEMGEFDIAQEIYDLLANARSTPDAGKSILTFRMDSFNLLKMLKSAYPINQALKKIVFSKIDEASVEKPKEWDNLNEAEHIDRLDGKALENMQLYKLKTGITSLADIDFWQGIGRVLDRFEDRNDLRFEMVKQAVLNSRNDVDLSDAVYFGLNLIDLDVAGQGEHFSSLIEQYRDKEKYPQTYMSIRFYEVFKTLRAGEKFDIESAFSEFDDPFMNGYSKEAKLLYYIDKNNTELLKATLKAMTPKEIFDPLNMPTVLRAMELASMEDEAALVRTAAEKEIKNAVLDSWSNWNWDVVSTVFELSKAAHGKPLYPEEWFEYCLKMNKNDQLKQLMLLNDAELRGDWEAALNNADAFLASNPTAYDYYQIKGLAEHNLGLKEKALKSLNKFVKFCHDNIERGESLKIISEIQQTLNAPQPL